MELEELERFLRRQLADMHNDFQLRAKPIVDQLIELECLKPPPPIFVDIDKLPKDVLERLQTIAKDNHGLK